MVVAALWLGKEPRRGSACPAGQRELTLPPSRRCGDGREGQGPTRAHRCTNTHRKIKICLKKKKKRCNNATQRRFVPIAPSAADAAVSDSFLTLPLPHTRPLAPALSSLASPLYKNHSLSLIYTFY